MAQRYEDNDRMRSYGDRNEDGDLGRGRPQGRSGASGRTYAGSRDYDRNRYQGDEGQRGGYGGVAQGWRQGGDDEYDRNAPGRDWQSGRDWPGYEAGAGPRSWGGQDVEPGFGGRSDHQQEWAQQNRGAYGQGRSDTPSQGAFGFANSGRGQMGGERNQGMGDARHGHDHNYRQWREQMMKGYDDDFAAFNEERQKKFDAEFSEWRNNRAKGKTGAQQEGGSTDQRHAGQGETGRQNDSSKKTS